jgi:hypothetical protein
MNRITRVVIASLALVAPATVASQATTEPTANIETAAPIERTARVTGAVREPSGRPVAHVRVTVIGLGRDTRTNDRGNFVLDSLPAATLTLEAVRIGSIPGRAVVELTAGQTTLADVTLGKGIMVLETREITDQWASEIERRARVSTSGYFVKPAEIAARGRNAPLGSLLYQIPSVKVSCMRSTSCSVSMRKGVSPALSPTYCSPSLYVDGVRDRFADFGSLYSGEILAIEVYRDVGRPFEFTDNNQCGAIAVWLKPLEPRAKKSNPRVRDRGSLRAPHSVRNTVIGSTFVALREGT